MPVVMTRVGTPSTHASMIAACSPTVLYRHEPARDHGAELHHTTGHNREYGSGTRR